jgi:hypothetical protein
MLNGLLQELIPAFDKKNYLQRRAPPLSLRLDFVYGFLAYDKRRTLFYVHFYSNQSKKKKAVIITSKQQQQPKKILNSETRKKLEQLQKESIMLPANFQREMLLGK